MCPYVRLAEVSWNVPCGTLNINPNLTGGSEAVTWGTTVLTLKTVSARRSLLLLEATLLFCSLCFPVVASESQQSYRRGGTVTQREGDAILCSFDKNNRPQCIAAILFWMRNIMPFFFSWLEKLFTALLSFHPSININDYHFGYE